MEEIYLIVRLLEVNLAVNVKTSIIFKSSKLHILPEKNLLFFWIQFCTYSVKFEKPMDFYFYKFYECQVFSK